MATNAIQRYITVKDHAVDFIGWNIKTFELKMSTSYVLKKKMTFFISCLQNVLNLSIVEISC